MLLEALLVADAGPVAVAAFAPGGCCSESMRSPPRQSEDIHSEPAQALMVTTHSVCRLAAHAVRRLRLGTPNRAVTALPPPGGGSGGSPKVEEAQPCSTGPTESNKPTFLTKCNKVAQGPRRRPGRETGEHDQTTTHNGTNHKHHSTRAPTHKTHLPQHPENHHCHAHVHMVARAT